MTACGEHRCSAGSLPGKRDRQRGVALAIVVWFIAAMSLLVAGIVYQAKLDLRMAQAHVAQARVAAAGDGAIQLMLASVSASAPAGAARVFRLGDLPVTVQLVPGAGLVDLNLAPRDLLVYLVTATGVAADEAERLADNVIKWRSPSATSGGHRFDAIENLLQVEGFDRVRIDAVRDLVVAASDGGSVLNPALAPDAVLAIFARKDPDKAARIASERRNSTQGGGAAGLSAGVYRADALVNYGGQRWLRRRWLRVGQSKHSNLPWHFTRTEAPRALPGQAVSRSGE
jgi:hypothetical protein